VNPAGRLARLKSTMAACRAIPPLLLLLTGSLWASGASPEYAVKAAYIYNFVRFTEWPKSAEPATLTVCIYGKDPFGERLAEMLQGKLVHGQSITLRALPVGTGDWDGCQAVFFGVSSRESIDAALKALRGRPILTIGESKSFAEIGGMIGFVVEDGRVRFEVNMAAITAAGLQISSGVAEVGRVVRLGK
jgi:hypothetical protein